MLHETIDCNTVLGKYELLMIADAMRANKYTGVMPNRDKRNFLPKRSERDLDVVLEEWRTSTVHDDAMAIGMLQKGTDACTIDIDINNCKFIDALRDACLEEGGALAEVVNHAPVRYGSGEKEMWIVRHEGEPFGRRNGPRYINPEDGSQGIEIYGGNSNQQVALYGAHTVEWVKTSETGSEQQVTKRYRWRNGDGPHNIPLSDLPAVSKSDIDRLHELADNILTEWGWEIDTNYKGEAHTDGDATVKQYDLDLDQYFKVAPDGREIHGSELEVGMRVQMVTVTGEGEALRGRGTVQSDGCGGIRVFDNHLRVQHYPPSMDSNLIGDMFADAVASRYDDISTVKLLFDIIKEHRAEKLKDVVEDLSAPGKEEQAAEMEIDEDQHTVEDHVDPAEMAMLEAEAIARDSGFFYVRPTTPNAVRNKQIPEINWQIYGFTAYGFLTGIAGTSGVGKTRFMSALLDCMASGNTETIGLPPCKPASVLYVANEEHSIDIERRVKAYQMESGSGDSQTPITIMGKEYGTKKIEVPEDAEERKKFPYGKDVASICYTAMTNNIDVIFLDPLNTFGSGDENSNKDARVLMDGMTYISKMTGAAVVFMHHTPKNTSEEDMRGNQSAFRGAGAIYSALDIGLTLSPYFPSEYWSGTGSKTKKRRAEDLQANGDLSKFIVLSPAKERESEPLRPSYFKFASQPINEGGQPIGVVKSVSKNDADAAFAQGMHNEDTGGGAVPAPLALHRIVAELTKNAVPTAEKIVLSVATAAAYAGIETAATSWTRPPMKAIFDCAQKWVNVGDYDARMGKKGKQYYIEIRYAQEAK